MNITQALQTASKRVKFIAFGRGQYRVNQWSADANAWHVGNILGRDSALKLLHESRVKIALDLLGIEEGAALANSCTYNAYPKDWRQCVRDEVRADKLAALNSGSEIM